MSRLESEIRGFRVWRTSGNKVNLSPGAVMVFIEFLFLFDGSNWPAIYEISADVMALQLGISRPTFSKYRDELVDYGVLVVKSKQGQRAEYQLASFASQEVLAEPIRPPGLDGVLCVADALGVYINNYAEQKFGRMLRTWGGRKVIVGMLDVYNKEGKVKLDEFERQAYYDGKFGTGVSAKAGGYGNTDYDAGGIGAGEDIERETASSE